MAKRLLSIGAQTEAEWHAHLSETMTPEQMASYRFYIDRFEKAYQQRESPTRFFDDQNYTNDYIGNENAVNTYLRKKLNDSEVRINTGVTEKKIEAVHNELLAMNLQHEVMAYDRENRQLVELGQDMGDLVTKTNRMEEDEDFYVDALAELLTQRAVFVRDTVEVVRSRDDSVVSARVRKELIPGINVFLGDITIPAYQFDDQPYVVLYNRSHWRTAEQIWGKNPNWQRVIAGLNNGQERTGSFAYRFSNLEEQEVEIIEYISLPDNERMVMINGVQMFAPGSKETEIDWSFPGYNLRMVILKPISRQFAYGKPLTASAKTLQALSNESIRLLIRKFQQAIEPPVTYTGTAILSRDMWEPASITTGVNAKAIESLIDHQGVTQSEFAFLNLIEEKIEEFVGASNITQGLPSKERSTATEILEMQKQAAKNLGLAVLAASRLKREMTKLRIYSNFDLYLKPITARFDPVVNEVQNIFESFTVDNVKLDNGRTGVKRIQIMDRDMTQGEMESVFAEEERQEKIGNNIRFHFINRNKLLNLNATFFVTIVPQQREGSALDKVMFQDRLNQGAVVAQVAGRPLNGDKIIDDYERTWRARDWFQKQAPAIPSLTGEGEISEQEKTGMMEELTKLKGLSQLDSQLRQGIVGGRTQQPSINALTRV